MGSSEKRLVNLLNQIPYENLNPLSKNSGSASDIKDVNLLYHSMGKFSSQQTDDIFLIFPDNRLCLFMHIICKKGWSLFSWENKKNISNCYMTTKNAFL